MKPTPNAANEGMRQRIAIERNVAGVDRKDAALGHGSSDVRNDAMLAFIYDREARRPFSFVVSGTGVLYSRAGWQESARFGGYSSASQGTLKAGQHAPHDIALSAHSLVGGRRNCCSRRSTVFALLLLRRRGLQRGR